jgi:hypothetical protein
MQITIDTSQPLSEKDQFILRSLLDIDLERNAVADWPPVEPQAPKDVEDPPKTATVDAEEIDYNEAVELGNDDDVVKNAIQTATALVSDGHRDRVREVLGDIGAKRVSELTPEQAAQFLEAIGDD